MGGYKFGLISFDGALMKAMKRGVETSVLTIKRDEAESQKGEPISSKWRVNWF